MYQLRLPHKTLALWIDAICINQNDDVEKAGQIPLMTRIYSNAQQVCIWLGEGGQGTETAMDMLKHGRKTRGAYSNVNRGSSIGHGRLQPRFLDVLRGGFNSRHDASDRRSEAENGEVRELLSRPWFSRVWIMQEAIVGRRNVFMCSDDSIEWDDIAKNYERTWVDKYGMAHADEPPFGLTQPAQWDIRDEFYATLSSFRELWVDGGLQIRLRAAVSLSPSRMLRSKG